MRYDVLYKPTQCFVDLGKIAWNHAGCALGVSRVLTSCDMVCLLSCSSVSTHHSHGRHSRNHRTPSNRLACSPWFRDLGVSKISPMSRSSLHDSSRDADMHLEMHMLHRNATHTNCKAFANFPYIWVHAKQGIMQMLSLPGQGVAQPATDPCQLHPAVATDLSNTYLQYSTHVIFSTRPGHVDQNFVPTQQLAMLEPSWSSCSGRTRANAWASALCAI